MLLTENRCRGLTEVLLKTVRRAVLLASLCLLLATVAAGQGFDEYTLATFLGNQELQQFGAVEGTEANTIGESVFFDLTASLSSSYGAKPYKLTILGDLEPNADSVGGGQVFVNAGMVPILGGNRGLWAAALGHELSHDLLRHPYQTWVLLLREHQTEVALAQAQNRATSAAQVILLALARNGNRWLDLKIRRDQESQADRLGMVIMARAGYNPDFALALNRVLTQELGDRTRYEAFFGTHPRWATRALRELKEYDEAEAEFSRLWPDASQSPGGTPPPVAIIKSLHSSQDKPSRSLVLTAEIEAHNIDPSALVVFATFQDHGRAVRSESKENSVNGQLVGIGTLRQQTGRPRVFRWEATVPASALSGGHRKLRTLVGAGFNNSGQPEVLDLSTPVEVHFPRK